MTAPATPQAIRVDPHTRELILSNTQGRFVTRLLAPTGVWLRPDRKRPEQRAAICTICEPAREGTTPSVLLLNSTGHFCHFALTCRHEVLYLPPSGLVASALVTIQEVEPDPPHADDDDPRFFYQLVRRVYRSEPETERLLKAIYAYYADQQLVIVGSLIAATAYPQFIVGMMPTGNGERLHGRHTGPGPYRDKIMRPDQFETFLTHPS